MERKSRGSICSVFPLQSSFLTQQQCHSDEGPGRTWLCFRLDVASSNNKQKLSNHFATRRDMSCAFCYFHQPWGYPDVSWGTPPLVGLSLQQAIAFVTVHTKFSRCMGPWLGHAGHWLARRNAQAGLDVCQDSVSVLAFQKKDSLGVIVGWAARWGSPHRQRGFNSTPNTQGQIWRPPLLLVAQSMKSLFLCKDPFLPQ